MGTLFVVATPIGNMEDMTFRAIQTLSAADIILAEDTRKTGLLLHKYNIQTPMRSYYEEIEDKEIPEIIEALVQGKSIALVSDAGTPLISDPGFRLVRECVKRHIRVVSIPGASALLTALTSSGLPTDKFSFYGYPPEKQHARIAMFKTLSGTCIFYCAPHKLLQTLEDLKTTMGDVEIVIARELTKVHEEVWRGTMSAATDHFSDPKGEFVVLIHM